MTETAAGRLVPRAVVVLMVVATVFNDLPPILPVGELAKDGFIYMIPVAFLLFMRRPSIIAFPTGFTLLFLGFIGVIVASVVVNYDEISVAMFKGRGGMSRVITQGMMVALGPVVALMFYNLVRYGQARDISRGAAAGLITMAVVGFFEVSSWYDIPLLTQIHDAASAVIHGEESEFYPIRMRLTTFEASWAAVMLTFIFPFAMTRASTPLLFFYGAFVATALVLTQSRTAMLVIGFQFLVLIWTLLRRRRDQMIQLVTAGFIGLLVVMSVPDIQRGVTEDIANLIEYGSTDGLIDTTPGVTENYSNVTRLAAIEAGVSMFEERPVLGVGFGQYGFNYPAHVGMEAMRSWEVRSYVTEADIELAWPPAYSLHVRLLAEVGVVGYLLWLAIILPTLFRSLYYADGATYLGRMHLAVTMTLIGWMLLGASIDSFRFFGGWIALGVGLALPRPPQGSYRGGVTYRSA
ncbi:O-antigen ligase family protein [Paracoccus sediminicola]|uniref:O-antigen ligase family protein n=1 Tax=Paracoccus sediminicola TaxID=3017783 RepID=UPI0022F13603|nr:O-antigen ligase family protein [Paracoccus sediminicola]WBU58181.1 O-antigen ligase family protein [Paracoccus sediminicola]